jgi:hypothetical protein
LSETEALSKSRNVLNVRLIAAVEATAVVGGAVCVVALGGIVDDAERAGADVVDTGAEAEVVADEAMAITMATTPVRHVTTPRIHHRRSVHLVGGCAPLVVDDEGVRPRAGSWSSGETVMRELSGLHRGI